MNQLDKLFGGNPVQRIDAIILGMFKKEMDIIEAEGGMENEIRRLKATLIDDIFRVKKLLGAKNSRHILDITTNCVATFDEYYDLDLDALELKLARLSAVLNAYMRKMVEKNNRADWNPPERDFWR